MNKPAFQFYASDFIMGTSFLTAEETGGYIRLLCYQWTNGFIPNKKPLLKQLTGVFDDDALESILKKFKLDAAGNLLNERLESTRSNYEQFLNKQSGNGKKGGRPPKEINPNETQTKPKHNPEANPSNNPEHNPKESSSLSPSPSSSFSIPISGGEEKKANPTAWWTFATKEVFTEKVKQYSEQYPAAFLEHFSNFYTQDSALGKLHINHEAKFSLEHKLREWWSDPKTKAKYTATSTSVTKRNRPLL